MQKAVTSTPLSERVFSLPVVLLLSAFLLVRTLFYPLSVDNELYSYMGSLLLKGYFPYVGTWDQNFPGIIFLHAIENAITGHSIFFFRLWDVLFQLVAVSLIYKLTERFSSRSAAFLASIFYVLYYNHQNLSIAAERDVYVTILLLATLYCIETRAKVAALFIGISILFRPTNVLFLLPLLYEKRSSLREAFKLSMIAALPLAATLLIYFAFGDLQNFYEATFVFTTQVYNRMSPPLDLLRGFDGYYLLLAASPIGIYCLTRIRTSQSRTLLSFLVLSLLTLLVLYRLPYHYHPLITFLIICTSIGWVKLVQVLTKKYSINQPMEVALPIAILVLIAAIDLRGATPLSVLREWASGTSINSIRSEFKQEYAAELQVGKYLKKNTKPGDRIQGFAPLYPMQFADLVPMSRFITAPALVMRGKSGKLTPFQEGWRTEYLEDLVYARPIYFMIFDGDVYSARWLNGNFGHAILRNDFTALDSFLTRSYTLDTVIGGFTLYRRK